MKQHKKRHSKKQRILFLLSGATGAVLLLLLAVFLFRDTVPAGGGGAGETVQSYLLPDHGALSGAEDVAQITAVENDAQKPAAAVTECTGAAPPAAAGENVAEVSALQAGQETAGTSSATYASAVQTGQENTGLSPGDPAPESAPAADTNSTGETAQDTAQEPAPAPAANSTGDGAQNPAPAPAARTAEEIVDGMTLEEKIWQMFVVTPEQLTGVSVVTAAGETTKSSLRQYPVGGLIYMSANLQAPEQVKTMLSAMQTYALEIEGLPLFLCVDEEGGRVARIADNSAFQVEKTGAMGNVKSAEEARKNGERIGGYLSDLGFNVDFAPVADVLTNSANTVIGDRSFGSDPAVVSEYGRAFADGLRAHRILSTFKHFPGHGATEADTHKGYAYTNKRLEELMQCEMLPFSKARDYGIDMVMTAHISLPNVIGDDTPCSLSAQMITEVLRGQLGYEGLVITDALNMGAVTQTYSAGAAAKAAVQAGNDLLLAPADIRQAFSGILSAVQSGEIAEEQIDRAVMRIVRVKLRLMRREE